MTKQKILLVGTATIDLIFKGAIFSKRKEKDRLSLAYGGKYVVEEFHQCFGGGAANAAVSLSRQGFKTYLWARISKDNFGSAILTNLRKEKVNLELIQQDLAHPSVSAILLDNEGLRTIVSYRSEGDLLNLNQKIKKQLPDFSCLALFSLPNWQKTKKIELLRLAKKANLKVFLSLHANEYRRGLSWVKDYFTFCDILDLNIYELALTLGKKPEDLKMKEENFAKKLGIPIVLVTHDRKGSYFYNQEISFWQNPLKLKKRVDTTGAGDAFSAGFLGKYLKTHDPYKAMQFAAENAKAEIEVLGAQGGLLYDQ